MTRLSGRSVGRVSVSVGAMPVVVPVDYLLDDDSVVFRAPLDGGLASACDGSVIAFEVDDFAGLLATDARWSVHIVGVGSLLNECEQRQVAGLGTLAATSSAPNQVVRLRTRELRGHEIHATPTASA